jgi:hypothetical protein
VICQVLLALHGGLERQQGREHRTLLTSLLPLLPDSQSLSRVPLLALARVYHINAVPPSLLPAFLRRWCPDPRCVAACSFCLEGRSYL